VKNIEKQPNNTDVKKYLCTALLLLMEQKNYQDITVTDIAKKAGVSRMTYYRTYSSKEDILIQYFNDVALNFLNHVQNQKNITLYELNVAFFTFFGEHRNLISLLRKANLIELSFQTFIGQLERFYLEVHGNDNIDTSTNYYIHFIAGGLSIALIPWIEHGCLETPEQMAKLIASFINDSHSSDG
jgi:AcrR family transcriptional regulator